MSGVSTWKKRKKQPEAKNRRGKNRQVFDASKSF